MRTALVLSGLALSLVACEEAGSAAPEVNAEALTVGSVDVELVVNNGAETSRSKTVSLTFVSDNASELAEVCISNTETCTDWQPYASTVRWTMAGEGPREVFAWVATMDGEESAEPLVASIWVDSTKPVDGMVTAVRSGGRVSLSWDGYMDAGSGISRYKVVYSVGSAPASCSVGTPLYAGPLSSASHKMPVVGTGYGYRVCAIDDAGNMSTGSTTVVSG